MNLKEKVERQWFTSEIHCNQIAVPSTVDFLVIWNEKVALGVN